MINSENTKKAIIFCWSESCRKPFSIAKNDYIICADSGYLYAKRLNIEPNLLIGDFDSLDVDKAVEKGLEKIKLQSEKDDTDALFAVKTAIKRGFSKICIAGGLGGRLDHTLGAISVLRYAVTQNVDCTISDGHTRISILKQGEEKILKYDENTRYISVFPENTAYGVNIKGLKYPLNNAVLTSDFPIGISNEFIPKEDGIINVERGNLLITEILK